MVRWETKNGVGSSSFLSSSGNQILPNWFSNSGSPGISFLVRANLIFLCKYNAKPNQAGFQLGWDFVSELSEFGSRLCRKMVSKCFNFWSWVESNFGFRWCCFLVSVWLRFSVSNLVRTRLLVRQCVVQPGPGGRFVPRVRANLPMWLKPLRQLRLPEVQVYKNVYNFWVNTC